MLESNCLQFQQNMEFMKRQMQLFELSLMSKQGQSADGAKLPSTGDTSYAPDTTCVYCGQRPRSRKLHPCGHLAACVPCADRLAQEGGHCYYCNSSVIRATH